MAPSRLLNGFFYSTPPELAGNIESETKVCRSNPGRFCR